MSTFYTEPTTGAKIATDDFNNLRYQIFKLDVGNVGSSIPLTGSILDDSQLGSSLSTIRVGAMLHFYNATSDVWTRARSANNLTDNFAGGTVGAMGLAAKEPGNTYSLARTVATASGTTGTGLLATGPLGFDGQRWFPLPLDGTAGQNLKIKVPGVISTANSSSSLLASGATFTGTAEAVSDYSAITVYAYSDQASASGGLSVQFSSDGANWDMRSNASISASGVQSIVVPPRGQFYRVVYTNGNTAQTNFRLQSIFHNVTVTPSTSMSMVDNDVNPSASRTSAHILVYNTAGNVWNRLRDIQSASGTTGSGVLAGALLALNGNNYVPLVTDTNQNLKTVAQGDVAHGTADSGNPVKLGATAISHGVSPTAVTSGQRTNVIANRHGIPFVIGGHPNIQTLRTNFTSGQTNTILVSGTANNKIVVTHLIVTVDKATTVSTSVRIGFGSATTPTTTQVIGAHAGIDAGSGFNVGAGSGIIGIGLDGDNLLCNVSVPTGGSVDIIVTYYVIP